MFDDLFSHNSTTEGLLGLLTILGAALFLVVAIASALAISLDAERRNLSKWGTFALILIFFPISVVIWFLIRNRFEEANMFNYASAEILAKQSGRPPRPAPKPVSAESEGTEPEKRKVRIIAEEDYADAGERSSHRRRRRSSSGRSGSQSSRRLSVSNRCRKCRHRISSTVAACPHCGTKQSSE